MDGSFTSFLFYVLASEFASVLRDVSEVCQESEVSRAYYGQRRSELVNIVGLTRILPGYANHR